MDKVLVIDDTKNIRMLLTTCLRLRGYEVFTAENGVQALEIVSKELKGIDLIFLDIRMQGMNGTEVLKHVREMGITCPVIIMTAYATIKNAIDCTKLGAAAYLQKPFSPERVNAVLDEVKEVYIQKKEVEGSGEPLDTIALAKSCINEKRFEEAQEKLKEALSANPYDKEIYYLLAQVNEGMNNRMEAKRFYQIAELFDK